MVTVVAESEGENMELKLLICVAKQISCSKDISCVVMVDWTDGLPAADHAMPLLIHHKSQPGALCL